MRAFTTTLKRPTRAERRAEVLAPTHRRWARLSGLILMLMSACEPTSHPPPISSLPTHPKPLSAPREVASSHPPHASQGNHLEVWSLVLARRVRAQLPLEVNTRFSLDEPHVWAWAELSAGGGPRSVLLRWRKGEELRAEHQVSLTGRGRQRVWARLLVNPQDEGVWTLSLEDAQGERYQRAHFELYAPSDASPAPLSKIPSEELPPLQLSEETTPPRAHKQASLTPAQASTRPEVPPLSGELSSEDKDPKRPPRSRRSSSSRAQRATQGSATQRSTIQRSTIQRSTIQAPQSQRSATQRSVSPQQEAQDTQAQQSEVRRLLVATSVKHRRPVGVNVRFSAEHERLWGYLEVKHVGPPALLKMEWWREGELRSKLKVRIGESLRWRTWSWQRLRPHRDAGHWTLKVLSAEGALLADAHFEVLDEEVSPP